MSVSHSLAKTANHGVATGAHPNQRAHQNAGSMLDAISVPRVSGTDDVHDSKDKVSIFALRIRPAIAIEPNRGLSFIFFLRIHDFPKRMRAKSVLGVRRSTSNVPWFAPHTNWLQERS